MKTAPERYSFAHNQEVRRRNKDIVTSWLTRSFIGADAPESGHEIYQPYVRYQRNFLPEGRREYTGIDGVHAQIREHRAQVNDWEWTDLDILTTDYPQVVWVLADATYRLVASGAVSGNSYAFAFVLEDGKIRLIKEWLNPLPILDERGITVPNARDIQGHSTEDTDRSEK